MTFDGIREVIKTEKKIIKEAKAGNKEFSPVT